MHKLKVIKQGGRLSVVLPDEVVASLALSEGADLLLSETNGVYRLSRRNDDFDQTMASAQKVMTHYRDTFRELAK
ncbi:AbrB/MazE/SpoVT family DNA-binding domain-containing protein [Algihabitans albus]|uniref:hypothetical protein n=1 Tax=Algihabitans albus TaxID=2164067 RepID=UPI000E5CC579|nr:hypothetical protein [Algihabitans albus]